VNVGGEPERDDFGLPPVDIEIPDDARELDREVQAYHRELRAERRRMRARRLGGPLTRDGMVLPLLAGCLVLALVSGTLLTLFSAGQAGIPGLPNRLAAGPSTERAQSGSPGAGTAQASDPSGGKLPAGISAPRTPGAGPGRAGNPVPGSSAAGSRVPVGRVGGLLPDQALLVAGKETSLRSLRPAVLALVPAGCTCARAVQELVSQAAQAHVALYLVGTGNGVDQLGRLAATTGRRTAQVAEDVRNVLARTYQHSGLTAILVHADGSVAQVEPSLRPGLQLTTQFRQLSPAQQR
jgi:hypothetical protein